MERVHVFGGERFNFSYEREENMKDFFLGVVERLFNWGIPVLATFLAVTVSPWWFAVAALCGGVLSLELNEVKTHDQ